LNETILYAEGEQVLLNTTVTDTNLDKVWYEYNGANTTITGAKTGVLNQTAITTTLTELEIIVWANDTAGNINNSETLTMIVDSDEPIITINSLSNGFTSTLPINITMNTTATDDNLGSCWYYTSDSATNITFTCNTNTNITFSTAGEKTIYVWVNDTAGNMGSTTGEVRIANYTVSATTDKNNVGEGDQVIFTLDIEGTNIHTEFSNTNASMDYLGKTYLYSTKSVSTANKIIFTKTLVIPSGAGNITGNLTNYEWDWEIKNSTTTMLSGTEEGNITVYNVTVSDSCVGKYEFLNWSLYDQGDRTLVNVTSPNTALVEIDLTITSLYDASQTWTYFNSWTDTQTKTLCVPFSLLNETSYQIDWVMEYESNDRVREFHYLDNGKLDNSTLFNSHTSKDLELYNLASADSTTFLFSYTGDDGLSLPNAIIHTFRKYTGIGAFIEVERSKQDSNGETHVHLVEEDVIYYFMVTEDGEVLHTSSTYNAKCLSTPCQISLTGSVTETNWTLYESEGDKYALTSDKTTRTSTVTFDLEGSTETVTASLYQYDGTTPVLITNDSLTATSGSISLVAPLSYGNDTFFITVYKNDEFVKSGWADFTEDGRDYFGTFGAVLGALIVLTLILMGVSEGAGIIVFAVIGLIIIVIMQLVELSWLALISIIVAGGVIIGKLVSRRGKS